MKNLNITDFNQRVLFDERVIQEVGGIHHESYKPFYATWAHVRFESGDDLHGDPHKLNVYCFVVHKNDRLMAYTAGSEGTLARIQWKDKILHIHQVYESPDHPGYIMGRCFEKRESTQVLSH